MLQRTALASTFALALLAFTLAGCGSSSSGAAATCGTCGTTVANAATTTILSTPAGPFSPGAAVVLTATVSSSSATPTGVVTFLDGSTTLGTATLTSGTAALTVATLSSGTTHSITASYGGAYGFASSTSASVQVAVTTTTPPASITAHATFSTASANQTIQGFGGSEAFYGNYLNAHPYAAEINKALYDPVAGLGLSFLRLQNSYYLYNGANASSFDTDTPRLVTSANAAHGTPLTLLMTSWTPPATLKSNNSINGCTATTNGSCTSGIGTLAQVNGAYNYAGFAQFWYDSLTAYAALGVKPDYISIQNEPDFAPTYVGCRFNPSESPVTLYGQTYSYASYGKAYDTVYKKVTAGTLPVVPKMVGPETFSTTNAAPFMQETPTSEVSAVAHHMYNVSSGGTGNGSGGYTTGGNPDAALTADAAFANSYATTPKFQTEYYQTPGFYAAWDLHNALAVANDSVYFYWALAWPSTVSNGVSVDQAGLIQIDSPYNTSAWVFPHGWTYNDAYYAFKHYSFYIKPGYVRYNATIDNANERVSVYQSTDRKTTVIVALNVSATATDGLAVDLSPFTYSSSSVYRSVFSSASGERLASLGNVSSAGINLPPQSVVTIVLSN